MQYTREGNDLDDAIQRKGFCLLPRDVGRRYR
jgi:hypothetical protein